MEVNIREIALEQLEEYWPALDTGKAHVFTTPAWLKTWWKHFGGGSELFLGVAETGDGEAIGLAPLRVKGQTAQFIGDASVCDYLDFTVKQGYEKEFYAALKGVLFKKGLKHLILDSVRSDSFVNTHLKDYALKDGFGVTFVPHDVSLEKELPSTWEEYLMSLDSKQRHEIRRKLRRLNEEGDVEYVEYKKASEVKENFGEFLRLMKTSRKDKAHFLSPEMEAFFKDMASTQAGEGNLGLAFLNLRGKRVAGVLYFDYNNCRYLYNSGYDPLYKALSIGLLSKVLCIKDSIDKGKKVFDFLKGAEIYKSRLGGVKINLLTFDVRLT